MESSNDAMESLDSDAKKQKDKKKTKEKTKDKDKKKAKKEAKKAKKDAKKAKKELKKVLRLADPNGLVSFQSPSEGVSHESNNCSKDLQRYSFKIVSGS